MPAGKFDKLMTIQTAVETRVEGDVVQTWVNAGTSWASFEGLTSRELLQADQSRSNVTGKITLRETFDGLTQKHRLIYGSRVFNIDGIATGLDRDTRYGQALLVAEVSDG